MFVIIINGINSFSFFSLLCNNNAHNVVSPKFKNIPFPCHALYNRQPVLNFEENPPNNSTIESSSKTSFEFFLFLLITFIK